MTSRLPEDLVGLFGEAARDVIWYKNKLFRFLRRQDVPEEIVLEMEREKQQATVKHCQYLVDELEKRGSEGRKTLRTVIQRVADWQNLGHLEPEKQFRAKKSQKRLKKAVRHWAGQRRYQRRKEKEAQRERIRRRQLSRLDHSKLEDFRQRFDEIFCLKDKQERGDRFEDLLNDIFDYYTEKSVGSFRREGEQIDGQFYFDGHHYFVEVRWRAQKSTAADVSVLRDRARAGFGGDVRALFISFEGFTDECLKSLERRSSDERVILMDGMDLRSVLNADIAFDVLLERKLTRAVRDQQPFVPVIEILHSK